MGEIISSAFGFFDSVQIFGLSLTVWFVVVLVIGAILLFVRGNK